MDRWIDREGQKEIQKERKKDREERKKHIIYIHIIYGDQVDRWTNR